MVTRTYKQALDISKRENDDRSQTIFRTFIDEQIDEQSVPNEIINRLKLADGNPAALLILDQQYGQMAEPPVIQAQID